MTANASKNKSSELSVMSPVANRVSEAVLLLMQLFGMRKISCKKLKSSEYERIVAVVESFQDVPEEISLCGMLVKDALAGILASAGVVGLDISATDDELSKMSENYKAIVEKYKSAAAETAGSSDVGRKSIPARESVDVSVIPKAEAAEEPKETRKAKTCHGKSCKRRAAAS